jgi:hypothetical protein
MRRWTLLASIAVMALAASSASAGAATFSPQTADFGSVPAGKTSAPKAFVLTATEPTLPVNPATSDTRFKLVSENCPPVLTMGASCTLNVSFAPTGIGFATGTLLANSLDPGSLRALLSGTGTKSAKKTCKKKGKGKSAAAAKKKGCKKKKK